MRHEIMDINNRCMRKNTLFISFMKRQSTLLYEISTSHKIDSINENTGWFFLIVLSGKHWVEIVSIQVLFVCVCVLINNIQ